MDCLCLSAQREFDASCFCLDLSWMQGPGLGPTVTFLC